MTQHKIPTLAELHKDNPDAFANDQLKTLLNAPPNLAWVKKHPFTQVAYLPVDKVEYMLDRIFGRWRREIKSIMQIENSVVAVVRLWYWNPSITRLDANGHPIVINAEEVKGDWDYHDGTGAMPIQVDKDCKASDMVSIKAAAIQMAAPAAASYALKDAADNLGKLFGRDITRKDTVAFDPSFKEDPYVNSPLIDGEKSPPPPPPLPATLASKVVNQPSQPAILSHTNAMDSTPGKLGMPVIDFSPVFDGGAFAAPNMANTADKIETAAAHNIPLNF